MNWPKEWKEGKLDDLCTLRQDTCLPLNAGTDIYVGLEHIESGCFSIRTYGKPEQVVSAKNRFCVADVLYGKLRPYLDKVVVAEKEGICSTDILVFTPKNNTPSCFLADILHTDRFIQHSTQTTHGVNHPRTSWVGIKEFEIGIPPLPEQRKIAAVLFKIQKAIELQDAIIERTRELKKSTMQFVFTHGLRGEKTKQTEIGEMPEGWKVVHCEDVVENVTVGVVVQPASHYVNQGVPAFRSLNIREDRLNTDDIVFFSKEANDSYLSKSKLSTGDVVIVRTGYPGTACVIPPEYDDVNCIDLVIVRPREKVLAGAFLSRFFNSDSGKKQTLSSSYGLAQQHLNVGAVKTANIPIPSLAEQKEICKIVDGIDRKHDVHTSKKSVLQDLFKTMLNKLMSGQVRVKDLEIEE